MLAGGDCGDAPSRPPRAYPAISLRSLAPLSSGTKGAGAVCPSPSSLDSCLRRNDGGVGRNDRGSGQGWRERGVRMEGVVDAGDARPPPGIPRDLASLARAPFVGDERGGCGVP